MPAYRDPAQPHLDGMEEIDLLTGVVRRFATIRAAYPEQNPYTGKWCAWEARGGKELGRKPNASDEAAASRWLARPAVQRHIARARAEQEGLILYGGAEALADLLAIKRMAMGDVPVRVAVPDKEGAWREGAVHRTDLSAAKAAIELLLKHFGLLRDRIDLAHSGAVAHLAQLDDAALAAHIRRLVAEAGVDAPEAVDAEKDA